MLNDLFISCPDFLEVVKYLINVIFNKDIAEKCENNGRALSSQRGIKNKFSFFKFTILNFVRESDIRNFKDNQNTFSTLYESFKSYQIIAIKYIKYLLSALIFLKKIIHNKELDKDSKYKIYN